MASRVQFPQAPKIAEAPKYEFDKTYTFRLRKHKSGNFSGLWELTLLDKKGNVERLISDADALNFCMDNMMGELEGDGF
jgi:hypothetical protein